MSLFKVVKREFKRIFSKKSYIGVLVVLPFVLFFLFPAIYNKQSVENIQIGIVDNDHSELSRKLTTMIHSSHLVQIKKRYPSVESLTTALNQQEILGAVVVQRGFENQIKQNKNFDIHMYRSSASMVYGKIMYKALAQTILTLNAGILHERLRREGMPEEVAMNLANPIRIHAKAMYNPSYNYQNYLVPGLTIVSIQMILIMMGVLMINGEKEENTYDELIFVSNNSAFNIIFGKVLAYYIIGLFYFVLLFGVVFQIYRIPIEGDFTQYFVLFSLFLFACLFVAIAISSILSESLAASDIALFYTAPSFVFSGFTFPGWAMPWYDQYYSLIMPYTAFLDAYILVGNMSPSWSTLTPFLIPLMVFCIVGFSISFALIKYSLIKREGNVSS